MNAKTIIEQTEDALNSVLEIQKVNRLKTLALYVNLVDKANDEEAINVGYLLPMMDKAIIASKKRLKYWPRFVEKISNEIESISKNEMTLYDIDFMTDDKVDAFNIIFTKGSETIVFKLTYIEYLEFEKRLKLKISGSKDAGINFKYNRIMIVDIGDHEIDEDEIESSSIDDVIDIIKTYLNRRGYKSSIGRIPKDEDLTSSERL